MLYMQKQEALLQCKFTPLGFETSGLFLFLLRIYNV